jgi:hypothetical protein
VSSLSSFAELKHCIYCGTEHMQMLNGEVALHFAGIENIDKPATFIFPKILLCLDCGAAHFVIPDATRISLMRTSSADALNDETPRLVV